MNISTVSNLLKYVLLQDLHPDLESIQYHLKACYKPYISTPEHDGTGNDNEASEEDGDRLNPPGHSKCIKAAVGKKPCIVCNQVKIKGDSLLYRICEEKKKNYSYVQLKLNLDEAYTRCSTF